MCYSVMEAMRRVLLCDGDAPCAALYSGGCGGQDRFARGDGGDGGDALHVTLHAGGCGGWARFAGGDGDDASVLFCMLEAVECELSSLEVPEVSEAMRCFRSVPQR